MRILDGIKNTSDVKALSFEQRLSLCDELREEIISTVAKNGGHLASNLGVVELTTAIYSVFDMESDKLIFDVGHQCYAHKLLSGRKDAFGSLRLRGGISGFTKRSESSFDPFGAGHSGTSVSAAIGFAEANRLSGDPSWTVAVVGDGSFTNGMIYEALNNSRNRDLRLIIVLNDNEMSISQNVGALSGYFRQLRSSKRYFSFKHRLKKIFGAIPVVGNLLMSFARWVRDRLKRLILKTNLFEDLGLNYLGPLDGNDLKRLEDVLTEAKTKDSTTVIHICTKKGLGYAPAEEHPENYHAVSSFDPQQGIAPSHKETYSSFFGKEILAAAEEDGDIIGISAAMTESTGFAPFKKKFPERFFDVGIAEEHAMTFAAGLSAAGKKPVYAVYSTFAQRCFDQLLHDAAIQNIPLLLGIDRAGLVSGDGQTHQGIFDIALFSQIPNTEIYSPDTFDETAAAIRASLLSDKISVVRYPKGSPADYDRSGFEAENGYLCKTFGDVNKPSVALITFGRLTAEAVRAAEMLKDNYCVKVIKLIRIYPLNEKLLNSVMSASTVLFAEEGIKQGGVAQSFVSALAEKGYKGKALICAVDGKVPSVGSRTELFEDCGLSSESIISKINN